MTCPYRLPADAWVDDPTQWPPLSYPDFFNFLSRHQAFILKEK